MDKTKIIKRKNKVIMKKAIAMRCTQEDWDSIKNRIPKEIDIFMLGKFTNNTYIVLYEDKSITNGSIFCRTETDSIHETFNAKIFLEACGIELEQKFEITKEQVRMIEPYYSAVKFWFPEVFKKELKTGYYKHKNGEHPKWFCRIDVATGEYYGHNNTGWMSGGVDGRKSMVEYIEENCEPMTPQEVETALIGEWEKLGGKDGCKFINRQGKIQTQKGQVYFSSDTNSLNVRVPENEWNLDGCNSNPFVFKDGKFVKIIETITIQEAEKLLKEQGINKKIV